MSQAQQLRVGYVCVDPGIPIFGTKGASVHIQELVRAWRVRGARVTVFAARLGDQVPSDLADLDVRVEKVSGKGSSAAERELAQQQAADRIAEQLAEGGFDIVHERYSLFSQVLARVQADGRSGGSGRILEVNAPLVDEQRTHRDLVDEDGALACLAAQLAAADSVACVSEPVADWVRAHCPAPQHAKVVVTPNGVNTDRIQPVVADRDGDPVVVFVGTLKPWHGVEQLFRAATLATCRWRLRVIGDGPQRAALAELAREHGLDVEMVGALPPEQVPAALQGAMVAVAPYPASLDHYFSPLKVYEYGAAALPVVASRIGEIPRVVLDQVSGLLVPPSDPAALAAAIDELVADPGRARAMGAEGRRLMTEQHSWAQVLAATLAPLHR